MAQSTVLSATTSAANSADIVVAAGEVVSVAMFASDGQLSEGTYANIERKIGSNYQPVQDPSGKRGQLKYAPSDSTARTEWAIISPGTYRVSKPQTAEAVGIVVDS